MDKLKEIIDQLKDTLSARWEQIQDTDTYISLKERYDNLPLIGQRLVIFSAFTFSFLIVFSIPYGWFTASQESVVEFEDTKDTISNLLDVSQGIKNIPPEGLGLSSADLKTKIDDILKGKGLSKEQITSVTESQFVNPKGSNLIPPQISATGVESNLKKLTLKQIVDIGYEFEKISPLVKILNLEMNATPEDPHYYDVQFRVSSFSVKEPETAPNKNDRSKKRQ